MAIITSPLVQTVIGHAITVHRALGPGLFEAVYQKCFVHRLERHNIPFRQQVPLTLTYEGLRIACAYRADVIVAEELVVELKSLDRILPLHRSQVLTYLRLSGAKQARLINFNVQRLADGISSFSARPPRVIGLPDLRERPSFMSFIPFTFFTMMDTT